MAVMASAASLEFLALTGASLRTDRGLHDVGVWGNIAGQSCDVTTGRLDESAEAQAFQGIGS